MSGTDRSFPVQLNNRNNVNVSPILWYVVLNTICCEMAYNKALQPTTSIFYTFIEVVWTYVCVWWCWNLHHFQKSGMKYYCMRIYWILVCYKVAWSNTLNWWKFAKAVSFYTKTFTTIKSVVSSQNDILNVVPLFILPQPLHHIIFTYTSITYYIQSHQ